MQTPLNETELKEYFALMEIKENAIANTQELESIIAMIEESIAA